MATALPRSTYGLLAVVGLSTPASLLVESLVRHVLLPPEFDAFRAWMRPTLTPWVWGLVPLGVLATALGVAAQRWLYRRDLPLRRARLDPAAAHDKAVFESLMLASSVPQIPALLAVFAYLCGAALPPVAATITVSTVGVFALGRFVAPAGGDATAPAERPPPQAGGNRRGADDTDYRSA